MTKGNVPYHRTKKTTWYKVHLDMPGVGTFERDT